MWDKISLTRADGTSLVKGTDYTVTKGKYSHYAYSEPFTYNIYNVTTSGPIVISGGAAYKNSSLTYPLKSRITLGADVTSVTLNGVTALGELSVTEGRNVDFTLAGENYVDKILGTGLTTTIKFGGDGSLTGEHIGGVDKYGADPATNVGCNIVINSGTFNITAGYKSAIGGGQYGNSGKITINGGNITAKSNYGAAIGGGQNGSATEIVITDGEINATGSFGAAIGGGQRGGAENISISGGTIKAKGSHVGAAIGGGQDGDVGTVEITDGNITVIARSIGIGGQDAKNTKISISGGNIELKKLNSSSQEIPADAGMIGAANGSTDAVKISGGSFNVELPEDYLAEGTEIKKNEDGTYGVNEKIVVMVDSTGYKSLADAIANATPDANGTIIYEIYGKATVDSTGWIQVARADLTGLTKVEFVGKTSDAEICITGGLAILADQNYDIDVSFEALTLSKPNPTYGGDYGHSTNYFTTWLRNTNAAENTVTYTNCTFPNGACNNQYGKTVFDGCKFTNATTGMYNFWNYGGNTEIKNSTFTGVRGIKTYNEGTLAVAPTVKIENTTFDSLTEKAAIVTSKATDITLDNVSATKCTKGFFQKDIEYSGEKTTIEANGSAISGNFNITAEKGAAAAKKEFNISGGTFTSEVSSDYLADGFELKKNIDGTYGVKTAGAVEVWTGFSGPKVASYETIAEAVANLGKNNWIVITKDYTLTDNFVIPAGVYLDIEKGATLTVADGVTLTVAADCKRLGVRTGATLINNGTVLVCGTDYSNGKVLVQDNSTIDLNKLTVPTGYFLDNNGTNYFASIAIFEITYSDGSTKPASADTSWKNAVKVTLLTDVADFGGNNSVVAKNFVLDLGGFTLSGKTTASSEVLSISVPMTIKNGTIKYVSSNTGYGALKTSADVTIDSTATIDGGVGYAIWTDGYDGHTLKVNGTVKSDGSYAITSNGSENGGIIADCSIIVNDSAKIEAPNGIGIYHPELGTVTVNGGEITAHTGIEMCAGKLVVKGGKITSTGDNWDATGSQNAILDGAAVSIINRNYPGGIPTAEISGGEFVAKGTGAQTIKAYDYTNNTVAEWTNVSESVSVSGGTFSSIPANMDKLCAEGFIPTKNADGTWGIKVKPVATVGGVKYTTLAEAIAALNSTNHTLTLIDASAWDAATPVYWQAGTQSGYAAKLTDALTAAYKAKAGDITIVCRPGADVGAMTHGHVADNLTVYGNNAYISGGECDLEVDTYMYSRETGKQVATGGVYLDKAITITAYELDNLGVWGHQRHTGFTINISLNDCDGKAIEGKANVQRVYISGTTGVNNITVVGCDFLTKATALYSNADGKITIDNCSFAGSQVPVNFNHKANGTQTVTVKNSRFTNCGDNGEWKQFAAPVRFVNSGSGTLTATVDKCTFTKTVGANGDILLGDGRNGEASNDVALTVTNTAATVVAQRPGYYNGETTDTTKAASKGVTASETFKTSIDEMVVINVTGYVEDESGNVTISDEEGLFWFAKQVNSGNTFKGKTVKLANDITLTKTWTPVGVSVPNSFQGTFDGDGHSIVGMDADGAYQEYGLGFFKLVISATIKNVTFEKASVTGIYSNVVGIVSGYSYGSSTFENVHVVDSTVYAFGKVGGMVGMAEDRGATTTFKNCSVTGTTIHGGYNVAGFLGLVMGKCNISGSYLANNNIIIDEDSNGFGKVTKLDTAVTCDGSVDTCAGNGMVIRGRYIPNGEYYYSAYSDLYNHYGASSHDCTLTNGKYLANSEVVHDAPVKIGDVLYSDIQAAVDAVKSDEIITLLDDVDLGTDELSTYDVKSTVKNVTIDLGGHTLTSAYKYTIYLKVNDWTIQNGTITNTNASTTYGTLYIGGSYNSTTLKNVTIESKTNGVYFAIASNKNGIKTSITVEDGTKISGNYGVYMKGQPKPRGNTRDGQEILNVNGGEITGKIAAIAVFGAAKGNTKAGVIVNINGGKVYSEGYAIAGNGSTLLENTTININGGSVISTKDTAIYHPQAGTVNVTGGTVSGVTGGIQMCAGTLNVTGGTITATGNGDVSGKTGDGSIPDGAAVSIVNRGYPAGAPTAAISGGVLTSAKNVDAVQAYEWSSDAKAEWSNPNASVSGGKFTSAVPEEYCAEGFIPTQNEDGTYGVKEGKYVAQIGDVKYETLEEAFAAAKNGDTITLLSDVDLDEQIATGKAITIDGQGKYTIKATKKLVGTSGKAGMFYRTTSAQGTLTFLNVTLDGKGVSKIFLNEGGAGETVFDGVTSINGGGIAYGSGIHISGGGSHATIKNSTLTGSKGTLELNEENYYAANDLWVGGNVYVTVENSVIGTVFVNSAPSATATNGVVHGQLTITGENTKIDYLSGEEEAAEKVDKFGNNGSFVKIENGKFDVIFDMGSYEISGGKFKDTTVAGKYLDNKAFDTEADADGYYDVMAHPIESFGVTVGEGLSLRLYVRDEYRNGKLLVKYTTVGSNPEVEYEAKISSVIEKVDGVATIRYCARIFGITPQMADVIIKVQYVDENDVAIGSEKEVSILKYCQNYVKEDSPEAVKTFVSKMLEYCASAMDYRMVTNEDQIYLGYTWKQRADALRAEKVDICGEDKVKYEFDLDNLGTYTNIGTTFKTRGMVYDNIIRIYFAIPSEEFNPDYKYYMSGNEIHPTYNKAKDQWEFSFTIAPYEYCNSIRITIKDGEDEIGEYACSLAIILESFSRKSGDAETDALAKLSVAAYEYCRSLADYPTSKDFNQ